MSDKKLIDDLVSEHTKVEQVASVRIRFTKWLIICALCLSAGISMLGLREDWMTLFSTPILLAQNIFILIGILIVGVFSIKLSVPSVSNKKKGTALLFVLAGLWALILFSIGILNNTTLEELRKLGFGCIQNIIVIGLIPGVALFILIRQGIVLERKLAGGIGMTAAFGIGAYGVQFTCHNDGALHILIWHFLPLIILGVSGVFLGKKFITKL